jgi:hypothetical protein
MAHSVLAMSQTTPKSARKYRRRIENDAFAAGARFWSDQKTVWANEAIIRRPVNRDAGPSDFGFRGYTKAGKGVNVYLFRIKTKSHDEVFLKIGITNSMLERFAEDKVRYRFELLCCIGGLTRKQAISIEGRLHRMFSDFAYRPKFGFVSAGHTECFVDYQPIIDTTERLFQLVEEEKGTVKQRAGDRQVQRQIQVYQWILWSEASNRL